MKILSAFCAWLGMLRSPFGIDCGATTGAPITEPVIALTVKNLCNVIVPS
jgi:hypothetical protein